MSEVARDIVEAQLTKLRRREMPTTGWVAWSATCPFCPLEVTTTNGGDYGSVLIGNLRRDLYGHITAYHSNYVGAAGGSEATP